MLARIGCSATKIFLAIYYLLHFGPIPRCPFSLFGANNYGSTRLSDF